jgi:hypothetical protein
VSAWSVGAGGVLYFLAAIDVILGGSGMGPTALALCACLYIVATVSYCRQRNWGMAVAFGNYALSCVGLIYGWLALVFINYACANAGLVWAGKHGEARKGSGQPGE